MELCIKQMAEDISAEAIEIRRTLHQCAELSFCEYKTASFAEDYLEKLGLSVTCGIAETGVVGFLDAGKEETLLIRADMDALPVDEPDGREYKSLTKGVMHACGHDVHMAVALCCAKILSQKKEELPQNILFVFQPGEETDGGAEPMISAGILEKFHVTHALGLHVMNDTEVGKIVVKKGAIMASPDDFELTIHGRGGHGAYPHTCIDPIVVSAKIIEKLDALTTQSESSQERKVVTVCAVNGGSCSNVIPDTVHILGTARSLDEKVRNDIPVTMENIISKICGAYGATYDFRFNFRYPPLINDDEETERFAKVVGSCLGSDALVYRKEPSMAGDDFAYFAKEVPSVYFYLGSGNKKRGITEPLHSVNFDIDESCLKIGIAAIIAYALTK